MSLFFVFAQLSYSVFSIGFVKKVEHLDVKNVIYYANGVLTLLYPCKSTTSCAGYHLVLPKGKYSFEVWGASGGDTQKSKGGKGGYSYGEINLFRSTHVYANIGGKGTFDNQPDESFNGKVDLIQKGGFNGGGDGLLERTQYHAGAGGGGASDIRLHVNNLYHRVIVAGGGGGAGKNTSIDGGYGGGFAGEYGQIEQQGYRHYCVVSGGNQTSPGIAQKEPNSTCPQMMYQPTYIIEATFGYGGSFLRSDGSGWSSAGGGGGWYGGSRGCVYSASGAGGSGYIFTKNSSAYIPDDYSISEEYYMDNTSLLSGDAPTIPSPFWNQNQTFDGNGAVRITFLDVPNLVYDVFLTCHRWKILYPKSFLFVSLLLSK